MPPYLRYENTYIIPDDRTKYEYNTRYSQGCSNTVTAIKEAEGNKINKTLINKEQIEYINNVLHPDTGDIFRYIYWEWGGEF